MSRIPYDRPSMIVRQGPGLILSARPDETSLRLQAHGRDPALQGRVSAMRLKAQAGLIWARREDQPRALPDDHTGPIIRDTRHGRRREAKGAWWPWQASGWPALASGSRAEKTCPGCPS